MGSMGEKWLVKRSRSQFIISEVGRASSRRTHRLTARAIAGDVSGCNYNRTAPLGCPSSTHEFASIENTWQTRVEVVHMEWPLVGAG